MTSRTVIADVTNARAGQAARLLHQFFAEEGFDTPFGRIIESLAAMRAEPTCWCALALRGGAAAGIVTVTTALYIEWGRIGEIGDLYVVPEARGQGVGRQLIEAAIDWCRSRGCSAVSIVVTPEGERRHGLTRLYEHFGFESSGRTIVTRRLDLRSGG